MPLVPSRSVWTQQPTRPEAQSPDFAWDVLINQAFPSFNAASRNLVTPRGTANIGAGGRWQNWHGVNALEQINAPMPTTATGYTMLWVGPFQVSGTGAGVALIRTTGGGFRFEPWTTAGGVWMGVTHTGVAGVTSPGPWSYTHDSRPWTVLVSYDGATVTFEVVTPTREYAITTATVGMADGTGTLDLSANPGVFGAYLVGYARRPMSAAMRRRVLANPWCVFEKRSAIARAAPSGGGGFQVAWARGATSIAGVTSA